jgi:integrase
VLFLKRLLYRCVSGNKSGCMTEAQKLTLARIEEAVAAGPPAGKTQTMLWDKRSVGFGLKIRASGTHSWVFCFRPKGAGRREQSRTITIGTWPRVTLDAARTKATALAGEVAQWRDPAADLRVARTREKRVVSAAIEGYGASIRRRKLVAAEAVESGLKRELAPIAAREIDKLVRSDFVAIIEALENAGRPGSAANLRKYCHSLLEWCLSQGTIRHNVLAGLRRPRSSRAERLENQRTGRALSDDQIGALWSAAGNLGPFGGLIRLGLLSGMRRGELAGLRWSDVRDDRIVLEAHVTKMGVAHEIPITATVRALLNSQSRTSSPLVFPSLRTGDEMEGWSKLTPRAVHASGVPFRLHDLRRTARTIMSRCGVAEDVAELAIGHLRRGLVGTYNKDSAWEARVDAFERVGDHVARIVTTPGDAAASVVALSARADIGAG